MSIDTIFSSTSQPVFPSADEIRPSLSNDGTESKKVEQLAKQFEGVLLNEIFKQNSQMLESLKSDEDEEDELGGGDQIQSLYWSMMADGVSEQGGVGFWKDIRKQLDEMVLPQSADLKLDEAL